MNKAEYLAEYCANKKCSDKNGSECDNCMYEKGRADYEAECMQIFEDNPPMHFNREQIFWIKEYVKQARAEAYEQGRADAINNFVINAITEFQKFDKEHGYPTLGDISVILSDVAEQLKE